MTRRSYTKEEIAFKLSFVMKKYNQGYTIEDACRAAEIGKPTYFRWRKKYLCNQRGNEHYEDSQNE